MTDLAQVLKWLPDHVQTNKTSFTVFKKHLYTQSYVLGCGKVGVVVRSSKFSLAPPLIIIMENLLFK